MSASLATTKLGVTANFSVRYQQLNNHQRQAVDTIDGVVMVLAGPGTGKTELVAMRVANILRLTQLNPSNILCLTFTESGVAALRQRLLSIIGEAAYRVRVHTFHSFANEVIQAWPEKFSFAREFTVLSDIERVQLWQQILDQLPVTSKLKSYANPYLFLADVSRAVQDLKKEHIDPDDYQEVMRESRELLAAVTPLLTNFMALKPSERTPAICETLHTALQAHRSQFSRLHFYFDNLKRYYTNFSTSLDLVEGKREQQKLCTQYKNEVKRWLTHLTNQLPKQEELIEVYRQYQAALRKMGRYDYEDMILLVLDQLATDDELLAYYQEQFQYFLVDEYQDTNGSQNDLLFRLAQFADEPNLFVVGDDHQSIYRFQGASLANLLTIHERFKSEVQLITLNENYRSRQAILDSASAVISHNESNIERYLPGINRELLARGSFVAKAPAVTIRSYATAAEERLGAAQLIADLLESGVPPQEIVILVRGNKDAREIAPVLRAANIPIQVVAKELILDTVPMRQLIDILRYVAGDVTDYRLWQVLHGPWFKVPTLEVAQAQQLARGSGLTLLQVVSDESLRTKAGLTDSSCIYEVVQQLLAWQGAAANESVEQLLPQVLNESGFLRYFADEVQQVEVIAHASLLTTEARSLAGAGGTPATLAAFITHLELLAEHKIDFEADYVSPQSAIRVMTTHKAKGLEWQYVIILHAMEGVWDNQRQHQLVALPPGLVKHQGSDYDPNEDERRLFYVALTRAKEQVVISHSATSNTGRALIASRFVHELPIDIVVSEQVMTSTAAVSPVAVNQLTVVRPEYERELQAYLLARLSTYVMSVTHLQNYLDCPRLWYYRNLLQAPAAKSKHMALGTAVHAALFDLFGEAHYSKQYLVQQFIYHLQREVLDAKDRADSAALGSALLTAYFDKYQNSFVSAVAREFNFAGHGVHVDDLSLTGKIDKVELVDQAQQLVHVVDYKTGNPDGKSADLKPGGAYHRQLVFYQLLANQSKQFNYIMVSGEIDFVQPSKRTGKFMKSRITVSDDEVAQLTQEIRTVWADIKQLTFLQAPLCGKCEYCLLSFIS